MTELDVRQGFERITTRTTRIGLVADLLHLDLTAVSP